MTQLDPDLTLKGHTLNEVREALIVRAISACVVTPLGATRGEFIIDKVVIPYVAQLIRELSEPEGDDDHRMITSNIRADMDQLADEFEGTVLYR